ncbi:hypothetical protein diail_5584 [Diaporthe ilicicola]|nr:hypothetical protein diail_5584 [Diaporthe ilicicola]
MADEDEYEGPLDLHQGGNISIRRTWTNIELYRLVVIPRDGNASAKITAITWEQHPNSSMSEEQAKIDAILLCRDIAGCDLSAAPAYETELFSDLRTIYASTTAENGTAAENGM